ncbi:MAG: sensor domain-containing diguanylate cyclase [Acidobacteriota bacterium]
MKHVCVIYRSPRARTTLSVLARAAGLRMAYFEETISLAAEPFDAILLEVEDRSTMTQRLKRVRRMIEDIPIITFSLKAIARPPANHLNPPHRAITLRDAVRDSLAAHDRERQLAEARLRLKRLIQKFDTLINIVKTANSVLDPKRVTELIMENIQHLIPSEAWSILLIDEANQDLFFELAKSEEGKTITQYRIKVGEGIAGWVAATAQPVIVNDVAKDKRFLPIIDEKSNFKTHSILCAPLISRGRTLGVVEIINKREGRSFMESDMEMLLTLVEPAAIALENAILYQRAKELSITDDLTKLYNSRYLHEYLSKEIKRCKRYSTHASLIFLDLDGFKEVNDHYGHMTGGKTLIEVGSVIRGCVREADIIARYGGDEFTIILTETAPADALVIAERLRTRIREHSFLNDEGLDVRLSASLGIASYPDHGQTPEEIIQRADQAMYRVKGSTKNGVALAEMEDQPFQGIMSSRAGHAVPLHAER